MSNVLKEEFSCTRLSPAEPGRHHLGALVVPRHPGPPALMLVPLHEEGEIPLVSVTAREPYVERFLRIVAWWQEKQILDVVLIEENAHVEGASPEEIYTAFLDGLTAV